MGRRGWERLFFRLLVVIALFYSMAIPLFVFEPSFVPGKIIDAVGSISFGAGKLFFLGIIMKPNGLALLQRQQPRQILAAGELNR